MRIRLLLLAAVAIQTASAQTDPHAEPGVFGAASASAGADGIGLTHTFRGTVGYQLPNGFRLAATGTEEGSNTLRTLSVGPEIGYTRRIAPGATLALRLDARTSFITGGTLVGQGVRLSGVSSVLEGTVTRRFALGRGIDLAATGGLYGGVGRTSDLRLDVGRVAEGQTVAEVGVVVGLQAEFNGLGGRFAIGPYMGVPVVSTANSVLGFGAGRLYGSRGPSLVSFSF